MEKNYDARALLNGVFDFVTCQRPDGTFYGNGGGACRKGVESTPEEAAAAWKARSVAVASVYDSVALDRDFKDNISGVEISKTQLQEADKLVNAKTDEFLQKMENNDMEASLKDFAENRVFSGDANTASVIMVGMEEGVSPRATEGAAFDKFLATRLAEDSVKRGNPELSRAVDALKQSEDVKPFHQSAAMLSTSAGDRISAPEIARGVGSAAQLEFKAMPATGVNEAQWNLGNRSYVKGSAFENRRSYEREYNKKMETNVVKQITKAAKDNPNLNTVILGGGTKNKGSVDEVFKSLNKIPGSRTEEVKFEVPGNKGTTQTVAGRIMDVGGKGKTFVYDYGYSVSARQFQSTSAKFSAGQAFYNKRVSMAQTRSNEMKDVAARIRLARKEGRTADEEALKQTLREMS
jgi:hypothetical protein